MKKNSANEMQKFYSTHSCITDPGKYSALISDLPANVPELVKIIQGLILHLHWTKKNGVFPSNERKLEVNLRFVSK